MSQLAQVSDCQLQCLRTREPGKACSPGGLIDRCQRPPPGVPGPRYIARELDPDERKRIGTASDKISRLRSRVFSTSVAGRKKKSAAGVRQLLRKASDRANDDLVVHRTCDQPH